MYQRTKENNLVRVQYAETRLEPIWDCLVSILKDPQNALPRLEEYTFRSANTAKAQERISQCEKQIESILNQRSRVVRVFMDGGINETDYKEQLDDCNARVLEYQNQKIKYEQMLVKKDERKDRNEILNKLYKQVEARLENATYEDKQYILHLFVERINLFDKQNYAEVFFRFPASTSVKAPETVKIVSQTNELRLVLHVKTLSETERRRNIYASNLSLTRTKEASVVTHNTLRDTIKQ